MEPGVGFDHQVDHLIASGYPGSCEIPPLAFRQRLAPLRATIEDLPPAAWESRIPFVIVVRSTLLPADRAMPLVRLGDRTGFTRMTAADLERFAPVDGVVVPAGSDDTAYLLLDVDTGGSTLDMPPDLAMNRIREHGRSPLTIEEGVAVVTHYPDLLRSRNCFSMLGSRCGDRRVTALWLSAGRPRLGWCWAGAAHTWLGSASCGARLGVASRASAQHAAF